MALRLSVETVEFTGQFIETDKPIPVFQKIGYERILGNSISPHYRPVPFFHRSNARSVDSPTARILVSLSAGMPSDLLLPCSMQFFPFFRPI